MSSTFGIAPEYEIVEVCPHCEEENHSLLTEKQYRDIGYLTTCKHCGKPLMLCDKCQYWEEESCLGCDFHCTRTGNMETHSCHHCSYTIEV